MISKHLFSLFLILWILEMPMPAILRRTEPMLILNMANQSGTLPRNFRSCKDPFQTNAKKNIIRDGLDELNISGSAQFSEDALNEIIQRLGTPAALYIVDLRQESHGFLNGDAISWFADKDWANKGKTADDIKRTEKKLLEGLQIGKTVDVAQILEKSENGGIAKSNTLKILVKSVSNEEDLVKKSSNAYMRLYIADHMKPSDKDVDQFVEFARQLPQERWLHFHCEAGDGRTTTFMAIFDMMQNAKKVPLEQIIQRQHALGGIDLFKLPSRHTWQYPLFQERISFLKHFYEYAKNNRDGFTTPWSSGSKKIIITMK